MDRTDWTDATAAIRRALAVAAFLVAVAVTFLVVLNARAVAPTTGYQPPLSVSTMPDVHPPPWDIVRRVESAAVPSH
jgi:hypothetical protein